MAVLPFVNASGDPNAEYLSDGITESLINSLSQLPHLKVMSRDSAFHVQGKRHGCRNRRARTGGSSRLQGPSDAASATTWKSAPSWSTPATTATSGASNTAARSSDIFALQGDIAKEMTTMLRMRLTGEDEKRMAKSYTANPEAYQDYLKGRYWWNKRNEEGLNKGIEYFQQAIAKDPTYALAYAGLADCYSSLAAFGFVPPKEAYPKAKEAALKALEIDDTLAEAHTSLAYIKAVYDWDWSGAEREFQRAIELNPSYADAHQWYGTSFKANGTA